MTKLLCSTVVLRRPLIYANSMIEEDLDLFILYVVLYVVGHSTSPPRRSGAQVVQEITPNGSPPSQECLSCPIVSIRLATRALGDVLGGGRGSCQTQRSDDWILCRSGTGGLLQTESGRAPVKLSLGTFWNRRWIGTTPSSAGGFPVELRRYYSHMPPAT